MTPSPAMTDNAIVPTILKPIGGASLMVAFQCQRKKVIVVGSNALAANRVLTLLEADALITLVGDQETMVPDLTYRIQQKQIQHVGPYWQESLLADAHLVFLCQTTLNGPNDKMTVEALVQQCRQQRVPVNVTDRNDLCDFFMTSTYRDESLQIAISTNGQASKLVNRIRRHVISGLPAKLGQAVRRVGMLRKEIQQSNNDNGVDATAKTRRMDWLTQICEYWSMDRLAKLSEVDMHDLLEIYQQPSGETDDNQRLETNSTEGTATTGGGDDDDDDSQCRKRKLSETIMDEKEDIGGKNNTRATMTTTTRMNLGQDQAGTISLVGSGPGDPELLTLAAHRAIKEADLVLADKIVPAEVVAMVECELKIARKFPGNADAAQDEFNQLALKALQQGKKVVRLKQGDPFLFGRGGEEVIFFRKHGYTTKLIPGISSAVAGPLLSGVPLTHRSVASQFLVTTGTGRKGEPLALPVFEPSRTDVFLMAIHRLDDLVADLLGKQNYPLDLPCAIVERASCIDQRTVYGTLATIAKVLAKVGGSRPPGLLVTGRAINLLKHDQLPADGVIKSLLLDGSQQPELWQLHDPEGVC